MTKTPFTNSSMFRELIKMQRLTMSSRRRKSTRSQALKTWLYPISIERQYVKQIKEFMRSITDRMSWEIKNNLNRWIDEYNRLQGKSDNRVDAFPEDLKNLTQDTKDYVINILKNNDIRLLVTNIGMDSSEVNLKQYIKLTKGMMGLEFVPVESWEKEVISAWSETNYNLITTLPDEYIKKVNTLISEGVQYGKTSSGMLEELKKITETFNKARPELIARDQVGKLNGVLTQRRQEDAGIDMYIWMTAGDERVRGKPGGKYPKAVPSHWLMHKKICRWDDSTVHSDDGKTWKKRTAKMPKTHPGYEIRCRCPAIPFFENLLKEIDQEIEGVI